MSNKVDINKKINPYIKRMGNEYQRLSMTSCFLNIGNKDVDEQKSQIEDCLSRIDSLTREIRIILERIDV